MQCSGLFASFVLSLDKINLNLIKNKGWCRLMLIKYSEFLHWQCLMILLRVVDLISSNIPPSSSASMLDRDSWWFLSVSLLVPCQSFVFIQIWNHDFTRTTHQEKVYTTAFLPGTESIIRKDLFGFTKLFKSIMMHAKLPTVYTKKGIKITIKLNIFNVWTMESREKLRLVSVKCWRWNTEKNNHYFYSRCWTSWSELNEDFVRVSRRHPGSVMSQWSDDQDHES